MNPERDLERQVHEALRRLPLPRAPRSLAPRVMHAVIASAGLQDRRCEARTGLRADWRQWPLQWQLLALVVSTSMAAALVLAASVGSLWIANLTATRAIVTVWQTFVAPIALPLVILTAAMCVACALLAAALKYVAWEGQEISHS